MNDLTVYNDPSPSVISPENIMAVIDQYSTEIEAITTPQEAVATRAKGDMLTYYLKRVLPQLIADRQERFRIQLEANILYCEASAKHGELWIGEPDKETPGRKWNNSEIFQNNKSWHDYGFASPRDATTCSRIAQLDHEDRRQYYEEARINSRQPTLNGLEGVWRLFQIEIARKERAEQVLNTFNNQLFNGDCLTLIPTLPDKSIRLLLTDPPYGMDFQSNRRIASAQAPKIEGDATSEEALALFATMLNAVSPKLQDDCHLLIFTHWRNEAQFMDVLEMNQFDIRASLVWVKENHGSGDLNGFAPRHERIIHASRGHATISPRLDDVLFFERERSSSHPAEKPTALMEALIGCTTIERELVFDPFAGTGAALIAAQRLHRQWTGSEIDIDYYQAASERLERINGTISK